MFASLLRTQLQLHFQRSLCNTLTWDFLFQWRLAELKTETVSRMDNAAPFDCCCSHQSVASPSLCYCVRGHGGHFSRFCGVFMVKCVKLMLRIFEFGVLLFDCFVYRQNVTCLQRFYQIWALRRWGGRQSYRQTHSCLWSRRAKNYSVQFRFDDAILKVVGFVFVDTL